MSTRLVQMRKRCRLAVTWRALCLQLLLWLAQHGVAAQQPSPPGDVILGLVQTMLTLQGDVVPFTGALQAALISSLTDTLTVMSQHIQVTNFTTWSQLPGQAPSGQTTSAAAQPPSESPMMAPAPNRRLLSASGSGSAPRMNAQYQAINWTGKEAADEYSPRAADVAPVQHSARSMLSPAQQDAGPEPSSARLFRVQQRLLQQTPSTAAAVKSANITILVTCVGKTAEQVQQQLRALQRDPSMLQARLATKGFSNIKTNIMTIEITATSARAGSTGSGSTNHVLIIVIVVLVGACAVALAGIVWLILRRKRKQRQARDLETIMSSGDIKSDAGSDNPGNSRRPLQQPGAEHSSEAASKGFHALEVAGPQASSSRKLRRIPNPLMEPVRVDRRVAPRRNAIDAAATLAAKVNAKGSANSLTTFASNGHVAAAGTTGAVAIARELRARSCPAHLETAFAALDALQEAPFPPAKLSADGGFEGLSVPSELPPGCNAFAGAFAPPAQLATAVPNASIVAQPAAADGQDMGRLSGPSELPRVDNAFAGNVTWGALPAPAMSGPRSSDAAAGPLTSDISTSLPGSSELDPGVIASAGAFAPLPSFPQEGPDAVAATQYQQSGSATPPSPSQLPPGANAFTGVCTPTSLQLAANPTGSLASWPVPSELPPGLNACAAGFSPPQRSPRGSVSPRKLSASGSVSPRQLSPHGSASPRQLSANGSVSPRQLSANGSVSPRQLSANGSVSPRQLSATGSVSPRQLSANGSVSPRAPLPRSAVAPRPLSPRGSAASANGHPLAAHAAGSLSGFPSASLQGDTPPRHRPPVSNAFAWSQSDTGYGPHLGSSNTSARAQHDTSAAQQLDSQPFTGFPPAALLDTPTMEQQPLLSNPFAGFQLPSVSNPFASPQQPPMFNAFAGSGGAHQPPPGSNAFAFPAVFAASGLPARLHNPFASTTSTPMSHQTFQRNTSAAPAVHHSSGHESFSSKLSAGYVPSKASQNALARTLSAGASSMSRSAFPSAHSMGQSAGMQHRSSNSRADSGPPRSYDAVQHFYLHYANNWNANAAPWKPPVLPADGRITPMGSHYSRHFSSAGTEASGLHSRFSSNTSDVSVLRFGTNNDANDAGMVTAQLLFSEWEIPPEEIEICKDENGADIRLSEGSYFILLKGVLSGVLNVAIKVVEFMQDTVPKELVTEVAVKLKELNYGPNIAHFHGASFIDEQRALLVFELVEGGNLRAALVRDPAGMSWHNQGKRLALQLAQGLAILHSNCIVHRNLKSSNILIDEDLTVKIADVGLVKIARACRKFRNKMVSSFDWAAPELVMGQRYDTPADIFSFGVVLWEICTTEIPIRGALRDVRVPEECPASVADIIHACMAQDPAGRPTADQLIAMISQEISQDISQDISQEIGQEIGQEFGQEPGAAQQVSHQEEQGQPGADACSRQEAEQGAQQAEHVQQGAHLHSSQVPEPSQLAGLAQPQPPGQRPDQGQGNAPVQDPAVTMQTAGLHPLASPTQVSAQPAGNMHSQEQPQSISKLQSHRLPLDAFTDANAAAIPAVASSAHPAALHTAADAGPAAAADVASPAHPAASHTAADAVPAAASPADDDISSAQHDGRAVQEPALVADASTPGSHAVLAVPADSTTGAATPTASDSTLLGPSRAGAVPAGIAVSTTGLAKQAGADGSLMGCGSLRQSSSGSATAVFGFPSSYRGGSGSSLGTQTSGYNSLIMASTSSIDSAADRSVAAAALFSASHRLRSPVQLEHAQEPQRSQQSQQAPSLGVPSAASASAQRSTAQHSGIQGVSGSPAGDPNGACGLTDGQAVGSSGSSSSIQPDGPAHVRVRGQVVHNKGSMSSEKAARQAEYLAGFRASGQPIPGRSRGHGKASKHAAADAPAHGSDPVRAQRHSMDEARRAQRAQRTQHRSADGSAGESADPGNAASGPRQASLKAPLAAERQGLTEPSPVNASAPRQASLKAPLAAERQGLTEPNPANAGGPQQASLKAPLAAERQGLTEPSPANASALRQASLKAPLAAERQDLTEPSRGSNAARQASLKAPPAAERQGLMETSPGGLLPQLQDGGRALQGRDNTTEPIRVNTTQPISSRPRLL